MPLIRCEVCEELFEVDLEYVGDNVCTACNLNIKSEDVLLDEEEEDDDTPIDGEREEDDPIAKMPGDIDLFPGEGDPK